MAGFPETEIFIVSIRKNGHSEQEVERTIENALQETGIPASASTLKDIPIEINQKRIIEQFAANEHGDGLRNLLDSKLRDPNNFLYPLLFFTKRNDGQTSLAEVAEATNISEAEIERRAKLLPGIFSVEETDNGKDLICPAYKPRESDK